MPRLLQCFLFATLLTATAAAQKPVIRSIDPPNWYANLPKPMLLIRGENLGGASFTLSDPALTVERTQISSNGHWAQLWLTSSPATPESVTIDVRTSAGQKSFTYKFAQRRAPGDGPAGLSSADVLYLIMPDRFADADLRNDAIPGSPVADRNDPHRYHGGDLRGVAEHLDYVQQLGVTAVWLTPTVENNPQSSDYHGYGATDLYAVEPRLGTLADYKALAQDLHRRHMKLVFDDVPNHVGPHHPWVNDPPAPDWFHGSAEHHLDNHFEFAPVTDPHAAPRASVDALDGWFANTLADLNQANPAVRQYLTENMIWWIEQVGIDALRIDTFPYVQREFWQSYLGTLTSLYPHLTEIGEITTPYPSVNAYFAGGRTLRNADTHLSTPFDYPVWYTLMDILAKGKPMSQLESTLQQDWLYPHPEALVPFISNHDQVRFLSQPGVTPARLRLAFGLLMTLRGMPQLYYGDEILMRGGADPDNRRDFPGGFPSDPEDAFKASGRTNSQQAMFHWVAALGSLRAHSPALQTGPMQTILAGDSTFAYLRLSPGELSACTHPGAMLIALNRSEAAHDLVLPSAGTAMEHCHTLNPELGDDPSHAARPIGPNGITLHLPPNGIAIYSLH